jgi:hypothetical protein
MQLSEFTEFIKTGRIDRVTIYRPGADSAWSIYGYQGRRGLKYRSVPD